MKSSKYFFSSLFLLASHFASNGQIGNPAPDFTVTDTHGETHQLYDYLEAGKVVVLDFFYTTCGPCIFYAPQVNLAYEKYGCNNANVIFMSIDYNDTDVEVLAYDEQYEIHYPSVSGLEGGGNAVVNQYGITGFPTFYVIDSTKTIVEQIDPPTLQVFDFRFGQLGIEPADCNASAAGQPVLMEQMEIFPNPAPGDRIYFKLPTTEPGKAQFEIYDGRGQVLRAGQLVLGSSQTAGLEIGDLPNGVFLVKIAPVKEGRFYSGVFLRQ